MVKKLMLAVAMVTLLAAPSFAAVQNVKVSGSLTTTSIIRNGFDLGTNTALGTNNRNQNIVASNVGLGVAADLTDNVSTNILLTNEGAWGLQNGAGNNDNNSFYIDEANVTLKEFLYSPLTLKIGRQPLAYGNQLVIGNNSANKNYYTGVATDLAGNLNFDAIKAVLTYDPLTVDLVAAKVQDKKLSSVGPNTNTDLYGINANYKLGDKMSTVVEAYTFVKTTGNGGGLAGAQTKDNNVYVPGLRLSTNPIEGLNAQLEGAYEFGNIGETTAGSIDRKTLSAYALQAGVNYALPVLKDMKPVVSAGFTYLSGNSQPGSASNSKVREWQAVYGNQFVGTIWNTLFNQQNLAVASAAVAVSPIKDITAKLTWYGINEAKGGLINDAGLTPGGLNQPDSAVSSDSALASNGKQLGNEVDLDLSYAYTEDVKFGVSAGYFAPGKGLTGTGVTAAQDSATQLLSSVSVAF